MSTFAAVPPPTVAPIPPLKETGAPPLPIPAKRIGGGARSLRELSEDAELMAPPPWDLQPYTVRGRLTLLSAPPKAGKTTLLAHYAAAKSLGRDFLGQSVQPGRVLWVGPDEHIGDQVRRFIELGADVDKIFVWDGPGFDIRRIAEEAERIGADLVVLDTLPRIAQISDENDNAAWTEWSARALPLIRASGAAWVALHHHRKSGGKGGEAIRGGSAIFGLVDIAVSLEPVDGQETQRRLTIQGTRYQNAPDLLIELQDSEYVAMGEPGVGKFLQDAQLRRVNSVLLESPTGLVAEIAERAGFPPTTVRRRLDQLVALGRARREGAGGQVDPYRYFSTAPEHQGVEGWSGTSSDGSLLHHSMSAERSGGAES